LILSVQQLEVEFATAKGLARAARGVSFEVDAGETLGIVGESGSGKTVTALSIMRLLPPTARIIGGSVEFNGRNLLSVPDRELRRYRGRQISMVFQDSMTALNPLVTIGVQVTEGLKTHLGLTSRQAKHRAVELLGEVGIPEPDQRLTQYPHQLSGGLRQRVAIAIALGPNPSILIADEPTTALDVTIQAQIIDLLKSKQEERQMALIIITHDLGIVAGITDRVAVMYAGSIVEQGPTDQLFTQPCHPYTYGLLRSVPRLDGEIYDRLPSIIGSPPPIESLPGGCPFRPRCEFAIDRCEQEVPTLVDNGQGSAAACFVNLR